MSINRKEELQRIVDETFKEGSSRKNIFFINGIFGVGKSWLINAIEEIFIAHNLCDAFLKFDNIRDVSFLPDFILKCNGSYIGKQGELYDFTTNELSFYNEEYYSILNKIKHNKPDIFQSLINFLLISNQSYIKNKNNSIEINQIQNELKELIIRNTDRRLLFNTGRVFSEALVIDLIKNLFPIDNEHKSYKDYIEENARKSVLLCFDNFDALSYKVLSFLFSDMFPIAYNLGFNDFSSYNSTFINSETKVRDLIDLRIIIGLRQRVIDHFPFDDLDNFSDKTSEIDLKPFSRDDLDEIIRKSGFEEVNLEHIIKLTNGIPYILGLWLESKKYPTEKDEENIYYRLASDKINRSFTDEEKQWLEIASYLEKFDANLLRCFPEIHNNYKCAWDFFIINNDLIEYCDKTKEHIRIKSLIRYYLHKTDLDEKKGFEDNIRIIENTYNSATEILEKLNQNERTTLLDLCYFKRFDLSIAIRNLLQNNYKYVTTLIENHPKYFIKNRYTSSIAEEYRTILMNYNKHWDKDKYEEKKVNVGKTWEMVHKDLSAQKNRLEKESNDIQLEEKDLTRSINENKQSNENKQNQLIQFENELIGIKRKINQFAVKNNIRKAGFCFVLGLFIIFISFFSDSLLKNSFSVDALSTLRIFLQVSSLILGFSGLVFFLKYLFSKTKKKDIEILKKKINNIEKQKEEINQEIQYFNEEINIANSRIDYIKEKNKRILQEISDINAQIRESYV